MALTIALDGPVGAGKSTIADELAAKLGILHLDTGAMYRALGLKALREGVSLTDEAGIAELMEKTKISVRMEEGKQHTLLDGEDVSGLIRTQEVGQAASAVAVVGAVRVKMVALQREIANETDMIVDGRDIGTRVLQNATCKFFLTASAEERARRRWLELKEKGMETPFEKVLEEVIARDKNDSERAVDPLRKADDAIEVDTTKLDKAQTIDALYNLVMERR